MKPQMPQIKPKNEVSNQNEELNKIRTGFRANGVSLGFQMVAPIKVRCW